jgi:hypothetical protein
MLLSADSIHVGGVFEHWIKHALLETGERGTWGRSWSLNNAETRSFQRDSSDIVEILIICAHDHSKFQPYLIFET